MTRTHRSSGAVARRAVLVALLLVATSTTGSVTAQEASPTASGPSTAGSPDIAAMVLRPSDLESIGHDGFGESRISRGGPYVYLATGFMVIPEAVDQSVIRLEPAARLSDAYLALAEGGWRRQFRSVLGRSVEQISDADPLVISTVAEYDTADGASAAFALLTDDDEIDDATPLDIARVGDESAAHRETSSLLYIEDERRTVTFRLDRYLATVQVDGAGTWSPEMFEPATLEALGGLLVDRIERVLGEDDPGLASVALHLAVPIAPFIERYDLLDRDVLWIWDESAEEKAARAERYATRRDIFRLDQSIPVADLRLSEVPRYAVTVSRFEDEAAAVEFLDGQPAAREQEPLPDAASFGDASLTFTETYEWEGTAREGFRIYVRVGDEVASLILDGPVAAPPLAAAEALAALQTECLRSRGCSEPTLIPAAVLAAVCPDADPVEGSPDPVTGEVAMARGDAGRTGRQAGPSPEGTPDVVWELQATGHLQVEPIVGAGALYVPTGVEGAVGADGALYAFDAASGELRWCHPTGQPFTGAQALAGDVLVGGHSDARVRLGEGAAVVALDATTGAERWRVFVADRLGDATVVNGIVYLAGDDGIVRALDVATGAVRWTAMPSEDGATLADGVAVADGLVYALDFGGPLVAYDAASGVEEWRRSDLDGESITGGPAAAGGIVIVDAGGALHALDSEDGRTLWSFEPSGEEPSGATGEALLYEPALGEDEAYIAATVEGEHVLIALDAADGTERWRIPTRAAIEQQPVLTRDSIVAADEAGILHAWATADGEPIWSVDFGDADVQPPVVVDGLLFVAADDGTVLGTGVVGP